MSNAESHEIPAEPFELISNPEVAGPDGPFFNRDWGIPLDIDQAAAEITSMSSPEAIIESVITHTFPPEYATDKTFQAYVHSSIIEAATHYRTVIHPGYPRHFADTDLIGDLYDLTDDFENCTLLHAIRVLGQNENIDEQSIKEAERLGRLMILGEIAPEMLEVPEFFTQIDD